MKILLADDHAIVRKGLFKIISEYQGIGEIDEAENGIEVINKIEKKKYDLLILDISMPGKSGLEVLQELAWKKLSIKTLVLSMHPEKEYAIRALRLGAQGYISKDKAAEELKEAMDAVSNGKKYISKELAEVLFELQIDDSKQALHEKLTDREYQVFIDLVNGKNVTEIAKSNNLSPKTISTQKKRILEKINVTGISELTKYAIQHNII